ncbi:endonuclease domain-containing protein [Sphingobium yanoikuyae]|jgi:very-short-patch-repair endonuclease|uniref:Endonuclease domain-containing protein n=1 Tax=Sphingobium yanoikuyae TaxID=13690 RepID=A0A430BTL4_SPHYA|nr:endonuclease domain-containing protein [Sphingobium yanoikuyae]
MLTGPGRTVKRARELRRQMPLPEGLLWQALRQRPNGFKFRRQHPAGIYILDFYCAVVRLAIEVDGSSHDGPDALRHDAARTHWLTAQGVTVLRIAAADILRDLPAVVDHIISHSQRLLPLHHSPPASGPPPRAGEE